MFCDTKCLFCDQDQIAKVNYSFYHGVCEIHKNLAQGTVKCSYCESIIPVLQFFYLIKCNYCGELTSKSQSSCGHFLCNSCSVSCGLCKNSSLNLSISIYSPSRDFESPGKSSEPTNDSKKQSYQIMSLSTESFTAEVDSLRDESYRKCEYCEEKNAKDISKCGHYLCKDCSKDECSLCSLLSATKYKSELYIIDETEKKEFKEKEMESLARDQNKVGDRNSKESLENITFKAKKTKIEPKSSVSLPIRKKKVKAVKVCNFCFSNLGPKRIDCDHYICKDCDDKENCKLCRLINALSIRPESDSSSDNHSPRDTIRNTTQEEETKVSVDYSEKTQMYINYRKEEANSDTEKKNRETGHFALDEKDNLMRNESKNPENQIEEKKNEDRFDDKKLYEISEEEYIEIKNVSKDSEEFHESKGSHYENSLKESIQKPKEKGTIEGDSKCCCIIS